MAYAKQGSIGKTEKTQPTSLLGTKQDKTRGKSQPAHAGLRLEGQQTRKVSDSVLVLFKDNARETMKYSIQKYNRAEPLSF